MAETPPIPPSPQITAVAPAASESTPVAPVTPVAPAPTLTEAPVRQAPPELTLPQVPTQVDGRIVSSNPQAQEIRIQTASGEVVVQSAATLPPDTKVSVELYTDQSQTLANIAVIRQINAQTQELEKTAPPPPPPALQAGKMVIALLLPEQTPVPLEKLATALETLKDMYLQKMQMPPLPPMIQNLLTVPDIKNALEKLPPPQLLQVMNYIAAHDVVQNPPAPGIGMLQKLFSAYLPAAAGGTPHVPATPSSSAPDTPDSNLLQIARTPLSAKPAPLPEIQKPGSAAPPPVPDTLKTLLSLIENMKPSPIQPFTGLPRQATPLPQNMYQLNILKILPPDTPSEQIKIILQKLPPASVPPQPAKVEAVTSGGFPILKTDTGHFVIKTPASVPIGSVVIFEAAPMTPEQIMASLQPGKAAPIPNEQDFDPLVSTTWPALQEALQVIQQSNPAVAQAIHNTLPTPTPHLVPTALFFLAALRLGAIDGWLGDNTLKALRAAGKKDLAEALGSDFSKLSRQSKEVLTDEWRSISMPLLHDDQVSQMQFYVRQQYDQESGGKDGEKKPATRFLLNLNLSRMGEMQLDGFIRKKHFDIVLRTKDKLPFDMRQEIMKRFAQGLGQVQMQGGISFQTREQGWVTVALPPQAGVVA